MTSELIREQIVETYLINEKATISSEEKINKYLDAANEVNALLDDVNPRLEKIINELEAYLMSDNRSKTESITEPFNRLLISGFRMLGTLKANSLYPAIKTRTKQYETYVRDLQELKGDLHTINNPGSGLKNLIESIS